MIKAEFDGFLGENVEAKESNKNNSYHMVNCCCNNGFYHKGQFINDKVWITLYLFKNMENFDDIVSKLKSGSRVEGSGKITVLENASEKRISKTIVIKVDKIKVWEKRN